MQDSLLVSLRKYRLRKDRDPIEGFITEAFCWLLRNYPQAGWAVLDRTTDGLFPRDPESGHRGDQVEWETQVKLGANRPDMMAIWPEHCVVFEHKVWSELADGQIERYKDALAHYKPGLRNLVVAITANSAQHNGVADHELCWRDIYETLFDRAKSARASGDQRQAESIEEFLALLFHEGLGPRNGISMQAVRYWHCTKNLESELKETFTALARSEWSIVLPEGYEVMVPNKRKRFGLEFGDRERPDYWVPTFLFGCIVDEADYCISHRTNDPMMLRLIISFFPPDLHQGGHAPAYTSLVDELEQVCEADEKWDVYHHLEDSDATELNPYHPLYLETPLLEVLRGKETAERQVEALHQAGKHALSLVLNTKSFAVLRDECIRRVACLKN